MNPQVVHQAVHHLTLEDVRENLRVEAACLVPLRDACEQAQEAAFVCERFVQDRNFWEDFNVAAGLSPRIFGFERLWRCHVRMELVADSGV